MNRRRQRNPVDLDLQAKVVKAVRADLNDENLLLELSDPVTWKGGIKEFVQAQVLSFSSEPGEEIESIFFRWASPQIDWERVWKETEIEDVWEAGKEYRE